MPNLFLHWLTLSSGCGYFGSVWLRSPNSLNYPTPVSYGYNKSKFNTCFCFHTRLTLLSSLVCSGYGIRSVRQTSTVCRHELHTPLPSLCSLSSPCELKLALLRYGLRALRQAPRLPHTHFAHLCPKLRSLLLLSNSPSARI